MTAEPPAPAGPGRDTARSSVAVAAGILVSRLGGLAREVALAATLGTSAAADAFRGALRIPQLLQNLLGEGALSAAFIPAYSGLLSEGRHREAGRLAGAIGGLIAAATAALVLVGALAARPLTALLAPGFEGATEELTVTLVRIMTAGIGFVVLAAWCLGVLNAHRRFFLPYAAPLVWNLAQMAALVAAASLGWADEGIAEAAAWGVLAGGVLQFAIQVPTLVRLVPDLALSLRLDLPETRLVLRRFGPAVAGRGVVQIGAYLDLVLASLLAVGSVAVMDFAQILYLLPLSLFAISVAAAELPELSSTTSDDGLAERLRTATSRVTFLVMGATVSYVVAGATVVAAVYEHGAFDGDDTLLVWLVLAAYSLGLVPSGASRVVQNGLFARGDTAGPARIALVRVLVAAGIGAVLMFQAERLVLTPPAHLDPSAVEVAGLLDDLSGAADLPARLSPVPAGERTGDGDGLRLGVVGLALGSAVGAWVELGLLSARLRRRVGRGAGLGPAVMRVLPAATVAGLVLVAGQHLTASWPVVAAAVVVLGTGGASYLAMAWFTGGAEVRGFVAGLARGAGPVRR